MNDLKISAIPIPLIEVVWGQVEPILKTVTDVSHGELTVDSVKAQLLRGDALLMTISENENIVAINTFEVREFGSGMKALYIPITGGKCMDGWLDRFLEIAKQTARDYGCNELRGLAVRKGWMRVLKERGWEDVHQVIRCKV